MIVSIADVGREETIDSVSVGGEEAEVEGTR
jgi:hypothetical protein